MNLLVVSKPKIKPAGTWVGPAGKRTSGSVSGVGIGRSTGSLVGATGASAVDIVFRTSPVACWQDCGYRHLRVDHGKHFTQGKVYINGLEGLDRKSVV